MTWEDDIIFRSKLKEETVSDLVQTMDLFLTSNNREIVQSVLGFVKVCVISLPKELMLPRLETLVPNLVVWSHEHKAHFRAKVKHIFERMIRRFGAEIVERYTPESDRKLITNIRKTRERRKRKKEAEDADGDDEAPERRKGKFESEYDEAVYGSESDEDAGSDISDDEVLGRAVEKGKRSKQGGKQYIVEEDDEPLDLLDKKALAHVSSTKPVRNRVVDDGKQRKKAKTDLDGKLVFNEDSGDEDVMDFDDTGMINGKEPGDGTLEGGINAYVAALKGKDAPQRGQRGKLKFSNKRGLGDNDDEEGMEIDEAQLSDARQKAKRGQSSRGGMGARGGSSARGEKQMPVRRGLGADKARGQHIARGGGGGGVRKAGGRPFKHGLQSRRGKR